MRLKTFRPSTRSARASLLAPPQDGPKRASLAQHPQRLRGPAAPELVKGEEAFTVFPIEVYRISQKARGLGLSATWTKSFLIPTQWPPRCRRDLWRSPGPNYQWSCGASFLDALQRFTDCSPAILPETIIVYEHASFHSASGLENIKNPSQVSSWTIRPYVTTTCPTSTWSSKQLQSPPRCALLIHSANRVSLVTRLV